MLWQPSKDFVQHTHLRHYLDWLAQNYNLNFQNYHEAWQWSVENIEDFWESIWKYFQVISHSPYQQVLKERKMPGAVWFEGATLNYAEHVFESLSPLPSEGGGDDTHTSRPPLLRRGSGGGHKDVDVAIIFSSERHDLVEITWEEMRSQVASMAAYLRSVGIQKGDCVAAYLPNIPEATYAFLACASIGAIWSSCSPDFGTNSIVDRFAQIEPKLLFAVDGYTYNGKPFDKMDVVKELCEKLPTVKHLVIVPYLNQGGSLQLAGGSQDIQAGTGLPNTNSGGSWQLAVGSHDIQAGTGLPNTNSGGSWQLAVGSHDIQAGTELPTANCRTANYKTTYWNNTFRPNAPLTFEHLPFDHPLYILYSSGTTGVPKAITHSHGGNLLEHLKYLHFHNDVHPGERFFWFSTTGWMMWNFVNASLLAGATIVLYDGSPGYPTLDRLWELAEKAKITHFGTSAPFLSACMKQGLEPGKNHDLSALRSIGSTGSPLPPDAFDWVYNKVKKDLWLSSMAGGTDVCTAWVGGNPMGPVWLGEIQCRCLGAAIEAWDEDGHPIKSGVGELVVTQPMPSMPVFFWGDHDQERYLSSYFDVYPGVWRHGDWIEITEHDGVIIYGRSDATLNRQGVRIGTAEIYRAMDKIAEVKDSLIVNIELEGGGDYMPLFVLLQAGETLDEELKKRINQALRSEYSPRHVPDEIVACPDIPYTISGKKMEAPVKKILMGKALDKVANLDSMRNPESLVFFEQFRRKQ